jgi:arginase family enzyme
LASEGNLIYLRNIQVAVNEAGDASLIGTIVNQKDTKDGLIALAINQNQVKLEAIPVLQNKPVIFGGDSANAYATIPNSGLVAGNRTTVSFFFGFAGTVSVDALIVNA